MTPQELLAPAAPAMTWTVAAAAAGALLAAIVGILWAQGRRVPAPVGVVPVLIPAIAAFALAAQGPALAAVGARLTLPLALAAPLAFTALFASVAAVARAPRAPHLPAAGAAVVLGASGIVVAAGYHFDDAFFATFRAVIYAVSGLMVVPSLGAGDIHDRPAPEASGAATAGWVLLVAAGESGARALGELVAVGGAATLEAGFRAATFDAFVVDVIDPWWPWVSAAVAVASLLPALAAGSARNEPARAAITALAVPCALLGLSFYTLGAPSAAALLAATP